jgi:hypothetical protein
VSEVYAIVEQEVGDTGSTSPNNISTVVHRWIGEKHMHETGRNVGSGNKIDYTEKDIRRAVAHHRIMQLIGAVTGKVGSTVTRRLREVASYHRDGWAVATVNLDGDRQVFHQNSLQEISTMLSWGKSIIIIPCEVGVLEPEQGEPALNTEDLDQMTDGNPYGH